MRRANVGQGARITKNVHLEVSSDEELARHFGRLSGDKWV